MVMCYLRLCGTWVLGQLGPRLEGSCSASDRIAPECLGLSVVWLGCRVLGAPSLGEGAAIPGSWLWEGCGPTKSGLWIWAATEWQWPAHSAKPPVASASVFPRFWGYVRSHSSTGDSEPVCPLPVQGPWMWGSGPRVKCRGDFLTYRPRSWLGHLFVT